MATHLPQLLRSLCYDTEWNYAVFWKLECRSRMVLAVENAYYNKTFTEAVESLHDRHFAHDPLGLAVAKMSYHVYSLGEGIVGQVAITGKHQWVFAAENATDSRSSPELCDGWQAQFSAGIKTIVVAAVVPHGVIQLGSLSKVNEDLKLLSHIRGVFSSFQDSLACYVPAPINCSLQSMLEMSDISTTLYPDVLQENLLDLDKSTNEHKCRQACSYSQNQRSTELMESSLTSDSGSDHLLEAVITNCCCKDVTIESSKSFSTSESILMTEIMPEPSINTSHTMSSSCYSSVVDKSAQNYLNFLDSRSIRSSTSACSEPLVRPIKLGKPNKKRARPGEEFQARVRDRKLIEDRIKELRELVPNGSKCSIDLLLQRVIKHMVFPQSINKRADKLHNRAKSRGQSNKAGMRGCDYEQGSCWAVEVGDHMKICPIIVENLNMNGQMLIEVMLCEDFDHFLEIAEAIRSLGLTILKGKTEDHGEQTWIRFVVENQSYKKLHRTDVLWSLLQILHSKAIV